MAEERASGAVRAILLVAVLLAGCATPVAPEGPASATSAGAPTEPLTVSLRVLDPAALFGEGGRVEVEAHARGGGRILLGLALPEGATVLAGETRAEVQVGDDERPTLEAVVRLPPGEHVLRAYAENLDWRTLGSRVAPNAVLGVRGDLDGAETFDAHACAGYVDLGREEPASPACPHRADVRLALVDGNVSRWRATVTSTVETEASVFLYVPEPPAGFAVLKGETRWNGRLVPGEPLVLEILVEPPAQEIGGYWAPYVVAHLDPAVDPRTYARYLYLAFEDGTLVPLGDTPPPDPDAPGTERPEPSPPEGDGGRTEDGETEDAEQAP